MRRSFLVAISLTLFMLLLVMLAAFYFSYQNQQTLQQRLTEARTDPAAVVEAATRSAADLEMAVATRQAALNALATAETDSVLLEGQLVASQQQAEELNRQIEALTESLEALATRETGQSTLATPLVAISHPDSDETLRAGELVEVIVAASDPAGLSSLHIAIGDEITRTIEVEAGDNLFVFVQPWTPAGAGEYVIEARAININGQESQTIRHIVRVLEAVEADE
jgi:ABC-type lipoprotein release transport system permease subunit